MMKRLAFLLGALVTLAARPVFASSRTFVLASPDEPFVWYNRSGDKVSQSLTWNERRQELSAHVAYNELEAVPLREQSYYDTFALAFPAVHLDPRTQRLYFLDRHGRRNEFGRVTGGAFGPSVRLDPEVNFSVFRGHDRVHAIISSGLAPRRSSSGD